MPDDKSVTDLAIKKRSAAKVRRLLGRFRLFLYSSRGVGWRAAVILETVDDATNRGTSWSFWPVSCANTHGNVKRAATLPYRASPSVSVKISHVSHVPFLALYHTPATSTNILPRLFSRGNGFFFNDNNLDNFSLNDIYVPFVTHLSSLYSPVNHGICMVTHILSWKTIL